MTSVPPRPLDNVDRRMLGILVDDGRMSVNELAIRAGVSRATAYARYDRLVADGVISRFRADINPHAIGLDVAAMILINVQQGSWPMTRDKVSRLPGVEYVAMTSGEFDFVLLVRVPDIAALHDVVLHRLQGMPEVRSTQTIFVLDEERHPLGSAHHLEPVSPEAPTRQRARQNGPSDAITISSGPQWRSEYGRC